jgi:hypothetical protein
MIKDIYSSFRLLPTWVQVWIALILVPVNAAAILFTAHPYGPVVALLAIFGMAANLIPMVRDREFGSIMALPHLLLWTPLVLIILFVALPNTPTGGFRTYLYILLIVDVISLAFDYPDAWKWIHKSKATPPSSSL